MCLLNIKIYYSSLFKQLARSKRYAKELSPMWTFRAACTFLLSLQDDPNLFDYNVPDRVNAFVAAANDQAQHYTTNNIMMTFGMDFNYQNAHENFKNIDKLIKYVNQVSCYRYENIPPCESSSPSHLTPHHLPHSSHLIISLTPHTSSSPSLHTSHHLPHSSHLISLTPHTQDGRVHAFYSTPSRYIDAVHNANKTWTLKTDDFFPYADGPYHYWTGYFTSRPALKGYTRVCNGILQACKQLEAIHNGFQSVSSMSLRK